MNLDTNNIKAIIFDFDGTLYDKKGFGFHLVLKNIAMAFIILTERLVRKKFKGKDFGSRENYYNNFFKEMNKKICIFSAKYYEKWYFKRYQPSFVAILQKYYSADENVKEIFKTLMTKNIKIAVNSDYPLVKERMLAIGLDYQESASMIYFSSEDYGALKPSPVLFSEIANKFGCEAENCLVIGDRIDTDGAGADNCNMKFIQLTYKKTKEPNAFTWEEIKRILTCGSI